MNSPYASIDVWKTTVCFWSIVSMSVTTFIRNHNFLRFNWIFPVCILELSRAPVVTVVETDVSSNSIVKLDYAVGIMVAPEFEEVGGITVAPEFKKLDTSCSSYLHSKNIRAPILNCDSVKNGWKDKMWYGIMKNELKPLLDIVSILVGLPNPLYEVMKVSWTDFFELIPIDNKRSFRTAVTWVYLLLLNLKSNASRSNASTIKSGLWNSMSTFLELEDFTWISFDLLPRK